jgi:methionyl-tRNA formyltransferase
MPSPVHAAALKHHLPVFTPKSLRKEDSQKIFQNHQADIAIVVAYGLMLPKIILAAPRYGCVNIHASLLPRWRGAAPIQRAIQAGDAQSGITFMQMDEGLDTGAMLKKEVVSLTTETTGQSLHDQLSVLGAQMILPLLETLDNLEPKAQQEAEATYAAKLSKDEAHLDFTKSAHQLERTIRAFTPWPGSYFMWQGRVVKVLKAHVVKEQRTPGILCVGKETLSITCAQDTLGLDAVQLQGKKPMDSKSFLNGYHPQDGEVL